MADFINARVIQKIATVSEWSTSTIIPYKGEIMLVSDGTGKVVNIKVGDGINHFNDLPYMFENMSNFNVSDAGDVSVAGRTDGQVLSWNADINKWVARNEQSLAGYATQAWVMSIGFLSEDDADLLYKPINWFPEWDEITDKPTTLAGFGITDVYTKSESDARYLDTLQSVTDRGNSTSLDISVRGVQLTDFLGLPKTPPDPSDVLSGSGYIWLGDGAEAGVPSAGTLAGLEDVSLSSLTNGQSLVWNASTLKWENATISSGGGTWGSITGVLSNQTDLMMALNGKQNVLVSGTNIKTINGQSILGSGNIVTPDTTYTASNGIAISSSNVISPVYGTTANTIAQGNDSRIVNGQVAYGWGNHASAGYAVSGTGGTQVRNNTQLDARYMQVTQPANNITVGDISNWNTAYGWGNHANAGYYKNNGVNIPTLGGDYRVFPAGGTTENFDWNSTTGRGFYKNLFNAGAPATYNSPKSGFYGYVENLLYSSRGNLTQYAHPYRVQDGKWMRSRFNGVWSDWVEFWHSGNLRSNAENDARYLQIGANAVSATKLATARTINGTAFDGTANITTASWGTARTLSYTGDVTGSSSVNGSANVATALTIANSAVTNAKLANMSANTFKGRLSTTGAPQDLTVTQVQTALGVTVAKQNEWNTAYAQRHTHSNKAFLDTINQNLSTSSSVEFDKIKVVSLLSIPTSAPTSPVSGEAYIWVEMD